MATSLPPYRKVLAVVVPLASVALGLAVATGGTRIGALLALSILVPLLVAPRRLRVGVLALLLVLLVNGVPFLDLSLLNTSGTFNFEDPVLLLLFAIGAFEFVTRPHAFRGRVPTWVLVLLCVFTASWVVGVFFGVYHGTPLLKAMLFGRDLFAVWLIAVVALVVRDRQDVELVVAVVVAAAVTYSIAHAVQVGLGVNTSFVTHPKRITETLGFARLYSRIIPMTVFSFFASLGYLLWGTTARVRTVALLAVCAIGVEQLLQLTRANYLALAVALVVGTVAALATRSVRWGVGKAGNVLIATSASVVGIYLLSLTSLARSSIWLAVQNRIASTANDVSVAGGNFGYRLILYREMLNILGNRWVLGLGFQHPEYHWFATLPNGTIRNSDVGVLGVLMPLGLFGLVPLLALGVWALARSVVAMRTDDPIVRIVGWTCFCTCIVALVSAPTLGYFSTLPGLLTTACAIGLLCSAMAFTDVSISPGGGDSL